VHRTLLAVPCALALLASHPLLASETYRVVRLPILDGDSPGFVTHVNENGQAALYSTPSDSSLLWQPGVGFISTASVVPGDTDLLVTGLSDDGRIACYSFGGSITHGFVDDHGTIIPLESPTGVDSVWPGNINGSGLVAGITIPGGADYRATIWDDGVPIELEAPVGLPTTIAFAINDAGVAAGTAHDLTSGTSHICLWTTTSLQDLGPWPGHSAVLPQSINEANDFCGYFQSPTHILPFRSVGGVLEELTLPDGMASGFAYSINDEGRIVGTCRDNLATVSVHVLWEDGVPIDIETLLEPDSGIDLHSVSWINNRGQIAAQAVFHDTQTLGPCLLTPVVDALAGNVNAQNGPPADVLFVNGSAGDAATRTVSVAWNAPITIAMDTVPARPAGSTRFALYAVAGAPNASTVTALPLGLGDSALKLPPSGPNPKVKRIWNNLGFVGLLGRPDAPSSPAPTTVFDRPSGLGRTGTFTFQGIIRDPASPCGIIAVTNGVVLHAY
jgi:uncharacterized membrane protein